MNKHNQHFLLLCCPAQGQINPTLQLAKRLKRSGALVTFVTTVHGLRRMTLFPDITFATFSDGYDDGPDPTHNSYQSMANMKRVGSETLKELLTKLAGEGHPVTFLIYTLLLPWAAAVAREMHLPSAFFCSHSATSFAIYNRFFHMNCCDQNNPSISIQLPGLPLFTCNDLPTFLLANSPFVSVVPCFLEHIQTLEEESAPCVLLNTCYGLEEESMKAVDDKIKLIPIGPLIPSAFSDREDPSDTSFGIDLFERSRDCDYLQWLNTKSNRSVIYVSSGSMVVLEKTQMEEILQGLIESSKPFLWIIRASEYEKVREMIEEAMLGRENQGLVVPWCSQLEVLSHKSTGCFMTHCGWNSIVESIISGVAIVGCPHYSDQTTNAKMVEEVWGNGVRAKVNEQGIAGREEIKRCLDIVMGDGLRGQEIRRNIKKLASLSIEAVREGGSSHNNFKHFLEKGARI